MNKEEHTRIKCNHCNTIIEGDGRGTYITCQCKKIAIDETKWYCRIIGNREDFEIENEGRFEENDKEGNIS